MTVTKYKVNTHLTFLDKLFFKDVVIFIEDSNKHSKDHPTRKVFLQDGVHVGSIRDSTFYKLSKHFSVID